MNQTTKFRVNTIRSHLLASNAVEAKERFVERDIPGAMRDIGGKTLRASHLVAEQLKASGIDTIFTVLGGPMIEILEACWATGIKVCNTRHEMNGCFAATSWGFLNQKPGVFVAASGPGMTNCMTPMYNATESAMPLLVLGGSAGANGQLGMGQFQEADQARIASSVCKWSQRIDQHDHVAEMVYIGLGKAAQGRPGAVYLDFSADIERARLTKPMNEYKIRTGIPQISKAHPDAASITQVANMLASAQRPLVLFGKGAAWSGADTALTALVNRGIPFVGGPMGRGTVADDNPHNAGNCRAFSMREADAILMVGGRFNWMFGMGSRGFAKGVKVAQIDIHPEEFYSGGNVDIGIAADAAVAVDALNKALEGKELAVTKSGWLGTLQKSAAENEATVEKNLVSDASPINHYRLCNEVKNAIDRDAIVIEDGEFTMAVCRQVVPCHAVRHRFGAGTTGCVGTGIGYAVGAKVARPDTQVVAVVGDYAFGAAASMEVETCVRMNLPICIVLSSNAVIAAHQIQDRSFPKEAPQIASFTDQVRYDKMVEMVGGHTEHVTQASEIGPALQRAFKSGKLSMVHVITNSKDTRRGGAFL